MDQISSKDGYKRIVVDGQRYYWRHVMVDSTLCNERLLELNDVNQFVADLVKRIDMVAYGKIVSARFGGGIETGISAVQLMKPVRFHYTPMMRHETFTLTYSAARTLRPVMWLTL